MKTVIIIMLIIMTVISITTAAHAKGPKHYNCNKVGVSKVKPYKFPKNYKAKQTTVVTHPMPSHLGRFRAYNNAY